jgi:hypothetical protein
MSDADELSEIRAEIERLRRREAALVARSSSMPPPPPRAGWPIRREAGLH